MDVLIWHNESQFSFPHTYSNTSEKNLNVFKKIYTMLIKISYTYYYFLYNFYNVFLKYILNELNSY